MHRIRRQLTYANVVATLALVFAMSGGAYALVINGALVQDESLTERDIRNGSLNASIAANAIDGRKVADDSLKGADVDESTLDLPRGDADTLDGHDSSAFLPADGQAVDSARLEGRTATDIASGMFSARIRDVPVLFPGHVVFGAVSGVAPACQTTCQVSSLAPGVSTQVRDLRVRSVAGPVFDGGWKVSVLAEGEEVATCSVVGTDRNCSEVASNSTVPAGAELMLRVQAIGGGLGTGRTNATDLLVGFRLALPKG